MTTTTTKHTFEQTSGHVITSDPSVWPPHSNNVGVASLLIASLVLLASAMFASSLHLFMWSLLVANVMFDFTYSFDCCSLSCSLSLSLCAQIRLRIHWIWKSFPCLVIRTT